MATLVAIAWPSLGLLPWTGPRLAMHAAVLGHWHGSADADHERLDLADSRDLPGSPLHPVDHDCAACQVLSHLTRCAPLAAPAVVVPLVEVCTVRPLPSIRIPADRHVSLLPPVRAPPRKHA